MTKNFNVYQNFRTPKIKNNTTIEEWFALIKLSDDSRKIVDARPFGKKHPGYEKPKTKLSCITYNFTFNDYKNNANIIEATGLLYIDIDDLSYDISSLDTNKVFAYYKSFGGEGYAVLVQVNGLTLDNYEATYTAISSDLGLTNIYDKGAKKATQFNVLSYDPNIFINYNSFIFSATNDFSTPSNVIKKKKTYTSVGGELSNYTSTDVRFNNLNEIEIEGDYAVNWNGWEYVNCWLPFRKIQAGSRNNTLLSYANNLVWLNPQLTATGAENVLNKVNYRICEDPVTIAQIKRIVASIFSYKKAGTLKPIYNRKPRKIVFANWSGLSRDEKLAICREELNKRRSDQSINKLYSIIEGWDFATYGRIGQTVIHKNFPISKKTVEKYWFEFKEFVAELNTEFKHGEAMAAAPVVEIAPVQPEPETVQKEKAFNYDIGKMDGYVMANHTLYRRATQLIDLLEKFAIERKIKEMVAGGYHGKESFKTDTWIMTFNINASLNLVTLEAVEDALIAA